MTIIKSCCDECDEHQELRAESAISLLFSEYENIRGLITFNCTVYSGIVTKPLQCLLALMKEVRSITSM